jgi:hypothetical protein
MRGIEPHTTKTQGISQHALTQNQSSVLPSSLAFLLQKYPDLAAIVEAWPTLPEHIKAAVMALIKSV